MNRFKENLNTAVFTTRFIIEDNFPIMHVFHYDDGSWQFSGSQDGLSDDDYRIVALGEIIQRDATILELGNMPINSEAIRASRNSQWVVSTKN